MEEKKNKEENQCLCRSKKNKIKKGENYNKRKRF